MTTVYHIRHQLARLGGNSFYRDNRIRQTSTFCGAPCTEYDAGWADRKRVGEWTSRERGVFAVCPQCKELAAR